MSKSAIYIVTNPINQRYYVGVTQNADSVIGQETARLRYPPVRGYQGRLGPYDWNSIQFTVEPFGSLEQARLEARQRLINLHDDPLCVNTDTGYAGICVLKYLHVESGQHYLGAAANFTIKRERHLEELQEGTHPCQSLQKLFDQDGKDSFVWQIHPYESWKDALKVLRRSLRKLRGNPLVLNDSDEPDTLSTGEHVSKAGRRRAGASIKERWADPAYKEKRLADGHGNARPVSIEGVEYPSASVAARALDVNVKTMFVRLISTTDRWKDWFYTDGKPIPVRKKLARVKRYLWQVYTITHIPTGKLYVGHTSQYTARQAQHRSALSRQCHPSPLFQAAWDLDPDWGHWKWEVVTVASKQQAHELEQSLIDQHLPNGQLLNRSKDAQAAIRFHMLDPQTKQRQLDGTRRYLETNKLDVTRRVSRQMKDRWSEEGARDRWKGGGNPFARKVEVNGVVYSSVKDAVKATGVSEKTIRKRANLVGLPTYRFLA